MQFVSSLVVRPWSLYPFELQLLRPVAGHKVIGFEFPEFRELKPDHFVACHRAEELQLEGI